MSPTPLSTIDQSADIAEHLAVPCSMELRELVNLLHLDLYPHRLVRNPDGLIEGIVDLRKVRRLLASENPVERVRWEKVTSGAIAEQVFAITNDGLSDEPLNSEAVIAALDAREAISVNDSVGCAAIVAGGDTFVSWKRICAALEKNHIDPVTLLPPRIAFNRRLREELDRAARTRQGLAVLLIDLDHFKKINDQYGHSVGDATLRMVAASLCEGVRSYDFVARYGGDEFTVICYNCPPADIRLPIARLQQAIAALPGIPDNTASKIGLSIGAAVLECVDEHCPPEVIVEQADSCLYHAKRSGRSTSFVIELDPFGLPLSKAYEVASDSLNIAASINSTPA